jgi:putative Ig domain-containing protein
MAAPVMVMARSRAGRLVLPAQSSVRNTVTVTDPGTQDSAVGTAVSMQVHASDSDAGQTLSYTAAGLPSGLSINPSTGLISGTIPASRPVLPHATVTVTVTARDSALASGSATFTWTVTELGLRDFWSGARG